MNRLMSRAFFVRLLAGLSGSAALHAHWPIAPIVKAPPAPPVGAKTKSVRWVGVISPCSLVVFDCKAGFV